MREIFTSGSVRGLIVTSGLLPPKKGALWALLDKNNKGIGDEELRIDNLVNFLVSTL